MDEAIPTEQVPVAQADRDAAGELWLELGDGTPPGPHDGAAAELLEAVAYAFALHREQSIAPYREALERALNRLEAIVSFGNPEEIAEDPENFGGTDDGLETVIMVYENMQHIAANGAADARTTLQQGAK